MRFKSRRQLEVYLAREVLGKELKLTRKPPKSEKRGPARDEDYKRWIRSPPCIACGSTLEIEAAHVGSDGGMKQKASDYFCVPLCSDCHTRGPRAYHGINGGRKQFEQRWRLDLQAEAARLYAEWSAAKAGAA